MCYAWASWRWVLYMNNTTTTIALRPFVWDYPGEPVPEEIFTHHPDHHPTFISFFHLPRSIASSLFKLCAWQSFCTTSVHDLFGLPLGLEPSTSYSIHFFTQLEMWANAQRDGRPAEYRWRPLFNTAKFGWRPLLECRAVTLPRRKTRWNMQGCPKLANRSQPLMGRSSPYCEDVGDILLLNKFFPDCRYVP